MSEQLDKVITKLVGMFDTWLSDFERDPLKTTIKVLAILWVVKKARQVLR